MSIFFTILIIRIDVHMIIIVNVHIFVILVSSHVSKYLEQLIGFKYPNLFFHGLILPIITIFCIIRLNEVRYKTKHSG